MTTSLQMEARLCEKSALVFSLMVFIATAAEYHPDTGFALGIYGPITQITQDDGANNSRVIQDPDSIPSPRSDDFPCDSGREK